MTFYIIYTPNSVKYFIHFVQSLLDYTPYHFCLVSNGCSQKERAILQNTTKQNKRLSYYCYPTNEMQIHGKVLTHLQAKCQEKYFCFMDSDIFATQPIKAILDLLENEKLTGLFSAMPIWVKKSEYIFKRNFKIMTGTYNQIEDNICIGSTYFAIYNNNDLNQIIQHYGLCFDECNFSDLPVDIQKELKNMKYFQTTFDTGKVINLFLNKHKLRLKNIEILEICHIGGSSYQVNREQLKPTLKLSIKQWLQKTPLKLLIKENQKKSFKQKFKHLSKEEFQINYNQRIMYRNISRKYFLDLYNALVSHQSLPEIPVFSDIEVNQNIKQIHQKYIDTFSKYFNKTN